MKVRAGMFWQKSSRRLSAEADHAIISVYLSKPLTLLSKTLVFIGACKSRRGLLEAQMYSFMFITQLLPPRTAASFLILLFSRGKYFHLSCMQEKLRLARACGIKIYKYTPSTV